MATIFAFPSFKAVILPFGVTVATLFFFDFHLTALASIFSNTITFWSPLRIVRLLFIFSVISAACASTAAIGTPPITEGTSAPIIKAANKTLTYFFHNLICILRFSSFLKK